MRTTLFLCLFIFHIIGLYVQHIDCATCSVTAATFETEFCTMKQEMEAVKQFDSRISNAEHELLTLKHTVQTETSELKENQNILQNLQKNISDALSGGGPTNNSTEQKLDNVLKMLKNLQDRLDHLEVKCQSCNNSTPHPCDAQPCQNGGKCLELAKDFQCVCSAGFIGEKCEFTDHCASSPCKHGGTCSSNILGHACHCATGFTGPFCEVTLNECDSNPCTHGRCILHGKSYKCVCDAGYDGPNCDHSIGSQTIMTTLTTTTVTHSDPCAKASVCNEPSTCRANGADDYICVCPETDKSRQDNCLTPHYHELYGFCCLKNTCKNNEIVC